MGEPVAQPSGMETEERRGGCLCGALRYRITGPLADAAWCHCLQCRKAGGAPAVAWVSLRPAQFAYERGTPRVYRSSARAVREFCPCCGSQLVFRMDDPGQWLDVTTASLDAPLAPDVAPVKHVWHAEHLAWMDAGPTLPAFPGDDDPPPAA